MISHVLVKRATSKVAMNVNDTEAKRQEAKDNLRIHVFQDNDESNHKWHKDMLARGHASCILHA